ncbi:MAG: hypothetical protein JOY71_25165, partial [Acetobacteraceae bacterium]|nr:hypothetical protein [Acetobacteraceae bacterium]
MASFRARWLEAESSESLNCALKVNKLWADASHGLGGDWIAQHADAADLYLGDIAGPH